MIFRTKAEKKKQWRKSAVVCVPGGNWATFPPRRRSTTFLYCLFFFLQQRMRKEKSRQYSEPLTHLTIVIAIVLIDIVACASIKTMSRSSRPQYSKVSQQQQAVPIVAISSRNGSVPASSQFYYYNSNGKSSVGKSAPVVMLPVVAHSSRRRDSICSMGTIN